MNSCLDVYLFTVYFFTAIAAMYHALVFTGVCLDRQRFIDRFHFISITNNELFQLPGNHTINPSTPLPSGYCLSLLWFFKLPFPPNLNLSC